MFGYFKRVRVLEAKMCAVIDELDNTKDEIRILQNNHQDNKLSYGPWTKYHTGSGYGYIKKTQDNKIPYKDLFILILQHLKIELHKPETTVPTVSLIKAVKSKSEKT